MARGPRGDRRDRDRVDLARDHVFDDGQLLGEFTLLRGQLDELDAFLLTGLLCAAVDQGPAFVGIAVRDVGHRGLGHGGGHQAGGCEGDGHAADGACHVHANVSDWARKWGHCGNAEVFCQLLEQIKTEIAD